MLARWIVRVAVAEFLVIVLLSVWLWSAKREPESVQRADNLYQESRIVRDSAKAERVAAVTTYRAARESLPPVAPEVEVVLTLADSAIVAGERSEAAAGSALARADDLIAAPRKANKPKLIQPWGEVLYNPYSREYVGRIGINVAVLRGISVVAAAEARASGPGVLLGARVTF